MASLPVSPIGSDIIVPIPKPGTAIFNIQTEPSKLECVSSEMSKMGTRNQSHQQSLNDRFSRSKFQRNGFEHTQSNPSLRVPMYVNQNRGRRNIGQFLNPISSNFQGRNSAQYNLTNPTPKIKDADQDIRADSMKRPNELVDHLSRKKLTYTQSFSGSLSQSRPMLI